jgi:hypothetical protein
MHIAEDQVKGYDGFDLENGALNQIDLRSALEKGKDFQNISLEIEQPEAMKRFVVHGQRIGQIEELPVRFLLYFEEDQIAGDEDAQ